MIKKIISAIVFVLMLIVGAIEKNGGKLLGKIGEQAGEQAVSSILSSSEPTYTQKQNIRIIEPTEQEIRVELIKSADQVNKKTPMMLDKETRLDRIEVGSGTHVNYLYTLVNYSSQDINSSQVQEVVKLDIEKGVCASEKLKNLLNYGVIYSYVYSGNDGIEISRIEIKKDTCIFMSLPTNVTESNKPLESSALQIDSPVVPTIENHKKDNESINNLPNIFAMAENHGKDSEIENESNKIDDVGRDRAKNAIDDANKQINIIWNGSAKKFRKILLPEQREWLKKRQTDCDLKATTDEPIDSVLQDTIRFNCMAEITITRTGEIEEKVKTLEEQADLQKAKITENILPSAPVEIIDSSKPEEIF